MLNADLYFFQDFFPGAQLNIQYVRSKISENW